ncbi:type II toxin-antitoxin system death-on-curing family toxin [Terriglobus sp. ADX1]|uniref:type II toxin-antitoxin system death-on-curing family toxin n=1 Tax=Terriglobus sp. ADX1 TaxID=2794063 RepID=UPI002FE57291
MSIIFVRGDALRNVQSRLIERYGGIPGVRDENLIESALARPRHLEHYQGETSIARLAAALSWAILRNHPFNDGNKRAAFAALMIFLTRNHHSLTCSEVEETAMTLRAAASEITEEEWTAWLERVVRPSTE